LKRGGAGKFIGWEGIQRYDVDEEGIYGGKELVYRKYGMRMMVMVMVQ
jgi:hypothetical protein